MKPEILYCDYETRSAVNIGLEGAYRYAMHPSTGIYTLGWAFDDEPAVVWVADEDPFPQRIIDHIRDGGTISAFNATFERLIFWYVLCPDYDVPEPKLEQFRCTKARAQAHGLPGNLKDVALCMQIPQQKQSEGTRLIRQYCAQNVLWQDIPDKDKALMVDYCRTDVEAERGIANCLRELSDHEWAEYHLNERINDSGIPCDIVMAKEAVEYATDCLDHIDTRIQQLTNGKMQNCRQRKARDEWLLPQLNEEQLALITKKKTGKISFDSEHRQALANHPHTPALAMEFIKIMEEAGGSTIAKYRAVMNQEIDGRVNGLLVFNGAGQTGRFSSYALQVHNMKRDVFEPEEAERHIADLKDGWELPEVTETLARLIRAVIYEPRGMSWCDWSSIEGRAAPWLAKSKQGDKKLQLYVDGIDPYKVNSVEIFHKPYDDITKDERQAGKVAELALGFLGGKGALQVMARNYGMIYTDEEAQEIVDAWRRANPYAKMFGKQLESAVARAMLRPNQWFEAGRVAYAYDGGDWLWCRLPSRRLIAYYKPKYEYVMTPWDEEVLQVTAVWGSVKPKVGQKWPRRALHGGILLENVTQGTCGCILRHAVTQADKAGLDIMFHVHDEVIIRGDQVDKLAEVMLDLPEWADDLPMAVSKERGTRYGK